MNNQSSMLSDRQAQPLALNVLRADINDMLSSHCKAQTARALAINPSYAQLWQTIGEQFEAGGKRIRPYLCMLLYEAYGGTHYRAVLPIAASLELVHAAMLIHDDIIDHDYVRHGKPNVAGTYRPKYATAPYRSGEANHFADSTALLAGDLLISDAYQLVNSAGIATEIKSKISMLIGDAIYYVVAGELLDSEAALFPPENADSLQIAELKTAMYSFTTPMLAAAFLTKITEAEVSLLQSFAGKLGVAFQLADDLLGVFGDSAKTGKSAVSDIREGKRSYLLQQTTKLANDSQKTTLDRIVGNPDCDEAGTSEIRAIMIETGAKAKTERLMDVQAQAAHNELELLGISEDYKDQLHKIIQKLVKRDA